MADQAVSRQLQRHQYAEVNANEQSRLILGDVYNYGVLFGTTSEEQTVQGFGLCLASAPTVPRNKFVGRTAELEQMTAYFQPGRGVMNEQKRLALGGIGDVGKTQLAIAFIRHHQHIYDSSFGLNATTETSLIASFRSLAGLFVKAQELNELGDEQIILRCHQWLSNVHNKHWLLVFDNYDDPEWFDINKYYPIGGHGSILVTTRRPDLMNDEVLRLQPLADIDDCLRILEIRSQRRDVKQDQHAHLLVERLGGFPLALVTAGAHLSKSTLTFEQYLNQYDQRWNLDSMRPLRLAEYRDRSLHTTWNLSYARLAIEDAEAAKILQLMAYFDNQDIWYDLLHAGLRHDSPDWLRETMRTQVTFDSVMRTLSEYCFVEVHTTTQSYSLHCCAHDWILGEQQKYSTFTLLTNPQADKRSTRHMVRLISPRFDTNSLFDKSSNDRLILAIMMGAFLTNQNQLAASEKFLLRVQILSLRRRACSGPPPTDAESDSILGPFRSATFYNYQGRLIGTKDLPPQAPSEWNEEPQINDEIVASIYQRLAKLYVRQNRLAEAEEMFLQAVTAFEAPAEPSQRYILATLSSLGVVYGRQGRFNEAESMSKRMLERAEELFGPEHNSALIAAMNLATVWFQQDRLDEAKKEMVRILAVIKKNVDKPHGMLAHATLNLSWIYIKQGRFGLARSEYEELLCHQEEALELPHVDTLETVGTLGLFYFGFHDYDRAELFWQRALSGYEEVSPNHPNVAPLTLVLGLLREHRDTLKDKGSLLLQTLGNYQMGTGSQEVRRFRWWNEPGDVDW